MSGNVREGSLQGGVPYLAVGSGPPLVMLPGLSGENPDDPSYMLVTIAAEDEFDRWNDRPRIAAPTLVVAGGWDGFYSRELFGETGARIPHARVLTVDQPSTEG